MRRRRETKTNQVVEREAFSSDHCPHLHCSAVHVVPQFPPARILALAASRWLWRLLVVTGIVFGKSPTFQVTLSASDNRLAVTDRIQRAIGLPDHKFTMVLYCAPSKDPGWPDRVTNDLLVLMNGRGDAKDRHLTKKTQLPWSHSLYARIRGHVDKVELVVEVIPTSSPPQSSSSAKETDPLLGHPDQTGATAHAVPEQSTKSAIPSTILPPWRVLTRCYFL
jgi:hypothetical protein